MNILLIRPRPHKETIGLQNVMICEPLELEYLSSNLEAKGHTTQIIDMILERKKLTWFLEKHRPALVALTGYIAHVNVIKDYAEKIKAFDPKITVVVGGVHAEVTPEDLVSPHIDYIVRANGIKTMLALVDHLNGKPADLSGVYTGPGQTVEKETTFGYLPPDRDKVARYRSKYYYMFHRDCSLVKTSFGCPYGCKFCFCRQVTDGRYFCRELDGVIAELASVKEEEIYIVDDDFLVDRDRILEFCRRLREEGIRKRYLIYGRADFIAANEDVIRQFKEVGLRAVIVGLESCDSKELVEYNKKTQVSTNEKAVAILRKYDVECYGTFILGLDWRKEDFMALGRWIRKLGLVFVNLQPLTPLRGTQMYEQYKGSFIVREDEYEKWDLAHLVVAPTNISARRYYLYTIMLYYKITVNPKSAWYMIRKYGLKDTAKLSVGAAKVNWQYIKKLIRGK